MNSISKIGGVAVLQLSNVTMSSTNKKAKSRPIKKGKNKTVDNGKGAKVINFDFYIIEKKDKNKIIDIVENKRTAKFTCKFFGKFKASIDSYSITESDKNFGIITVKLKLSIIERFGEKPNNLAELKNTQRALHKVIDIDKAYIESIEKTLTNEIEEMNYQLSNRYKRTPQGLSNLLSLTLFNITHAKELMIKNSETWILDSILPLTGVPNIIRERNLNLLTLWGLVNMILINGELNYVINNTKNQKQMLEYQERFNKRIGATQAINKKISITNLDAVGRLELEFYKYVRNVTLKKVVEYTIQSETNLLNILTFLYGDVKGTLQEIMELNPSITNIFDLEKGSKIWIYL